MSFEIQVHHKVDELLHAAQKGLGRYAGELRVAVALCRGGWRIYDPYGLLRPYARELAQALEAGQSPRLEGTVSFSHVSASIDNQIWFAEHSPDIGHPESIRLWLMEAARCLADEVALGLRSEVQSSRITLENYALYAIESFIGGEYQSRRGRQPQHKVMEILETLAAISLAREESIPTSGEILFADCTTLEGQPLELIFDPRPSMLDRKHLAKLFRGLWKGVCLVSCGREIWGIGRKQDFELDLFLRADFQSGIAGLFLGGRLCRDELELCTLSAGTYQARRVHPQLPGLMRTLKRCGFTNAETRALEWNLSILCAEITRSHHGATIVLETSETPIGLSGQQVAPARLDIQALRALSEVDGALHLDREGRLKGFGCLLDGMASAREDRAHGARFNSALRFTETHEGCLVIVISADGPISVFRKGALLGRETRIVLREVVDESPPGLDDWLLQAQV